MDPLVKYKESLLPILERSKISDDIDSVRETIERKLLPELAEAAQTFASVKSNGVKALFNDLRRHAGLGSATNGFQALHSAFEPVPKHLDQIDKLLLREFGGAQIATDQLTYRQAAILRYIQIAHSAVDYTLKFLRQAYLSELSALGQPQGDALSRNQERELQERFGEYARSVKLLRETDIERAIKDAPAVVIDESVGDVLSYTAGGKADPTQAGFIPLEYNPFYRIARWWIGIEAKRYHRMREQLAMYQIQRLRIEEARQGKANTALEQRAKELASIIDELDVEIREMEREAYA